MKKIFVYCNCKEHNADEKQVVLTPKVLNTKAS